ncbi:hypothetical protein EYF80_030268 [Liparis tanakae]|uniref:Uncharacterized protein n=1 Tax=Liparis tanakae TaxID=230148 RepID=A0A4Z2H3Z6_9TELE|nr:hypothetical protein EYF80_030268 [Liparis tanakae]
MLTSDKLSALDNMSMRMVNGRERNEAAITEKDDSLKFLRVTGTLRHTVGPQQLPSSRISGLAWCTPRASHSCLSSAS